jgi:transketolase
MKTTAPPQAQRDVFGRTMVELCDADPRVVLLDGDLANSTKSDILSRERPDRFFMMGIAEQNLAGVAAGMATVGLVPVIVSFAAFLATRALDQVRVVIAQPRLNVKLAGHYSGILTGYTGKTHQVINDIAIMRSLPHMTVVAPCDGVEVRAAMQALNDYDGPVYLRLTRDPSPTILPLDYRFQIGKGVVLREGRDVTLIGTGVETVRALEAADILAERGVDAYVLHLPTIKPLDEEAIVRAAARTGRVVTCEDHSILGGLGGAVAEVLAEQHPTPLRRIGLRDVDGESGPNDDLIEKYGLTARYIVDAALSLISAQD